MRRIASLVACAAFVGVGMVSVTAPAAAKTTPPTAAAASIKTSPYVALGDSYSSAAGVSPQVLTAPPACGRSQLNYAENIVAVTHPQSFTDVTCSGAKTSDFFSSQTPGVPPQLDAVVNSTRLVTMTIGGNDEGVFVNSFFGCVTVDAGQVYGNPCQQKYGSTFTDLIKTQTYPNLVRTLSAVRAKAPRATIVILGYPQILPPVGVPACYPVMPISMGDVPWLVNQQLVLNDAVRRAAAATGALYVDTYTPSAGHDACTPVGTRWLEPLVAPINALPVHPNATGETVMAQDTLAAIGATPTVTGLSPNTGPPAGGTTITITGTGLTGATAVAFGGQPAATFTGVSDTTISATSPAGTGTADVTVTTPGGTSAAGAADQFTYTTTPNILTVFTNSGPAAGGQLALIVATNVTRVSAVHFGTAPAQFFQIPFLSNIGLIAVITPPGTGTVDVTITITTPDGTNTTGPADRFTYRQPGQR